MSFEFQILDWLQTIHTPVLDKLMIFFTTLGNAGAIWILLTVVLLIIPKTRKSGVILFVSLLFDLLICNGILKTTIRRIRPYDVKQTVELLVMRPVDFSFPSGHTAASVTSVVALYLAKQKKLFVGSFVLAVIIAFSRMYLYVHYPTDILGGTIVGIAAGILGYVTVRKIESVRKKRKTKVQTADNQAANEQATNQSE